MKSKLTFILLLLLFTSGFAQISEQTRRTHQNTIKTLMFRNVCGVLKTEGSF